MLVRGTEDESAIKKDNKRIIEWPKREECLEDCKELKKNTAKIKLRVCDFIREFKTMISFKFLVIKLKLF